MSTQPTPEQALFPGRRVLQETQLHLSPAKGRSNNTATTLVARSPHANRSPHAQQQLSAIPANAHSVTTHIHSMTDRHSPTPTPHRPAIPTPNLQATPTPNRPPSPTPNRQPIPNPVQSVAWNTDAARVKIPTLRTNPHQVPFLDEEQQLRAATRAARGESTPRKAPQPVQFPQ